MNKDYDVIIIGAGPAGLSVLSSLHHPERIMNDHDLVTRAWKGFVNRPQQEKAKELSMSVCVIDPAGCWLFEWIGRFKALGIDFLRSPAWATPDYNDDAAIGRYALANGRERELQDVDLPWKSTKELRARIDSGLFKLPSSSLFYDFCQSLSEGLSHTLVKSLVTDLKKEGDMYKIFGPDGALVRGKQVVFALGASGTPSIPQQLAPMYEASMVEKDCASPRILHTYAWQQLEDLPIRHETIIVIGGGLSAVQAALLAVRRGASKVMLVSRKTLRTRIYDLSLDWFNVQKSMRTASQDENNSEKVRMFEFYETEKKDRQAWVKVARGGATVPPHYMTQLADEEKAGRVDLCVDEIDKAVYNNDGLIDVTFAKATVKVTADRIILATGAVLDVKNVPLLANVSKDFDLPVVNGLPDLDEELSWGNESFSVVGAFSMLEIGPESLNLNGCRRCAQRFVDKLNMFKEIYQYDGPLGNRFNAFWDSSSDEDSDGDDDDCSQAGDCCDNEDCSVTEGTAGTEEGEGSSISSTAGMQFEMDEEDCNDCTECCEDDFGNSSHTRDSGATDRDRSCSCVDPVN